MIKKKFNGKSYEYEKSFHKKKNAQKMAKQIRKIRPARVIKEGHSWSVYRLKR